MRIRPFQALRPRPEGAAVVTCPPYDTVTTEEARRFAEGNPSSFMHVIRPEIDLPDGADPHSPAAYAAAADTLKRLEKEGTLVRENDACLYVYRQTMGAHTQTGVVACCHTADYASNAIRRHELTRADKETDRANHIKALSAHTGPAFLTYRDAAAIDELVACTTDAPPLLRVRGEQGVDHAVWPVRDSGPWVAAFERVPHAYIADGHHRTAAAARVAAEQSTAPGPGAEAPEASWFLAVLLPAGQLNILPYNRCVRDLNGLSESEFLGAVGQRFRVSEDTDAEPAAPHQVGMYLAGRWRRLSWDVPPGADAVARLDASHLQNHLLEPVLGIADPRRSSRIEFVGGIRGTEELTRQVDTGGMAVAFSMYPVTVDQMMDIADAGQIMPPKSTWFEPKLRSGLFVHTFGEE